MYRSGETSGFLDHAIDGGTGEELRGGEDIQAGSNVSMSILKYTGFSVPTLSLIFWIIPAVPMVSISRASEISKPQ